MDNRKKIDRDGEAIIHKIQWPGSILNKSAHDNRQCGADRRKYLE